ncbi:MAG: hypothetical protein IPM58_12295 [Nitrospira sp.]|nr:hypothetical protein [Nitrospira sp.]
MRKTFDNQGNATQAGNVVNGEPLNVSLIDSLRLIADRTWLAEAARITPASSGGRTPGVDGVDKTMMTKPSPGTGDDPC